MISQSFNLGEVPTEKKRHVWKWHKTKTILQKFKYYWVDRKKEIEYTTTAVLLDTLYLLSDIWGIISWPSEQCFESDLPSWWEGEAWRDLADGAMVWTSVTTRYKLSMMKDSKEEGRLWKTCCSVMFTNYVYTLSDWSSPDCDIDWDTLNQG